jgi:opacity protein-like surface antigen
MKKILFSSILAAGLLALPVFAQDTMPPAGLAGAESALSNAVAHIDESTNLFAPKEVEFRLGAVYVQKTGQAGTLLAIEKWDLLAKDFGFGAESITSGNEQAAEFAYVAYRKTLGNVAGIVFLGAGYADIDKSALGVIGGRIEYRTSAHLGAWTSVSYGLESKATNRRGMVIGAGVNYAF